MAKANDALVLLAVEEVAHRLTISVRSVRALIKRGALPTIRVTDRRIAVAEADLAAYVATRRAAPGPVAAA